MLVLSRKRDEQIVVGEEIILTIVEIRGDKVRLGIQAPAEVPVHRREIADAIRREHGGLRHIVRKQLESGHIAGSGI